MRLHRLHVADFAAVADADIEFGPGLGVFTEYLLKFKKSLSERKETLYTPEPGDCNPLSKIRVKER